MPFVPPNQQRQSTEVPDRPISLAEAEKSLNFSAIFVD